MGFKRDWVNAGKAEAWPYESPLHLPEGQTGRLAYHTEAINWQRFQELNVCGAVFVYMKGESMCKEEQELDVFRKFVAKKAGCEIPVAYLCWWKGFHTPNFTKSSVQAFEGLLRADVQNGLCQPQRGQRALSASG